MNWKIVIRLSIATLVLTLFAAVPIAAQHPTGQAIITYPENGSVVGGQVSIFGSALLDDPNSFLYFKVEYTPNPQDDGLWSRVGSTHAMKENDLLEIWDTTTLYNGEYALRLTVVDETRNFIQSDPVAITIDNGPCAPVIPQPVEIISPVSAEIITGRERVFGTAMAYDPDRDFVYYKVEYGEGATPSEWHLISDLNYQAKIKSSLDYWDTTSVANGQYTLRLTVVDDSGNFRHDQVVVTVNNPPTPSKSTALITWPENGAEIELPTSIEGTAFLTDTQHTFASYTLEYGRGGNPSTWTEIDHGTSPTIADYFTTWYTFNLPNDWYTLRLRVQDTEGKLILTDQVHVQINNPPQPRTSTAEITWPTSGSSVERQVRIEGTASLTPQDYEFGSFTLEHDRGSNPSACLPPWTEITTRRYPLVDERLATWYVTDLPNGFYTIRLTVRDKKGNPIVNDQVIVQVDNPPPPTISKAEISYPQDGEAINWKTSIEGTAALDARGYDFGSFLLEYGLGESPQTWTYIESRTYPMIDEELADWDVTNLKNGPYTLRLTVREKNGDFALQDEITVQIDNPTESSAWISQPKMGAEIERGIDVWGTATLSNQDYEFGYFVLEYGPGSNPTTWIEIKARNRWATDEKLAYWDTNDIPNGPYTLRLTVYDKSENPILQDRVIVTINNPIPTPIPGPAK